MINSHVVRSIDAVRVEYSERQQSFTTAAESYKRQSIRALVTCGACVLLVLLLYLFLGVHSFFSAVLLIPALVALWQISDFPRYRRQAIDANRRARFYERGISRLDDTWAGEGNSGMDFARDNHLYQNDLDILGNGSLFELLATVRSEAGAERLAAYLLDLVTPAEAKARQQAVKELCSHVALREQIEVLGRYQFHDCSRRRLREWLDQAILRPSKAVPIFLAISSLMTIALVLSGAFGFCSWLKLVPMLCLSLASQGTISLLFKREVNKRMESIRTLGPDISLLRDGIELVAPLSFRSEKLASIVECLSARDSDKVVWDLAHLLKLIECSEDSVLYGLLVWVAARTQLILAVERWRDRHQSHLEKVLDAWAEFEALSALAGYAYEHPDDTFPELIGGFAQFEALEIGHPLLPKGICVTNDIALNDSNRFYIVSGSNMSGKSTLLRAIGLNAVLAGAGAPVRAKQARIAVMAVCASIGATDSLRDGASKFLAEVERLRDSVAKAQGGESVLFVVDEMLAGTNSHDRCLVTRYMLETLVEAGAVGALSTHDLALTEIAKREGLGGINVHMQSRNQDDPLDFDYRLRPGIATQTNGIAIAQMIGLQI
jgi:hypothetical protein